MTLSTVVDAQLHEPAVSLEWAEADQATRWDVLLEVQLAFMQAVGVDRAVLHPIDMGWGEHAAARAPGRFSIVPMVANHRPGAIDPDAPEIQELVAEQARSPAVSGLRIMRFADEIDMYWPAVAACSQAGLALFTFSPGRLDAVRAVAQRHPEMLVVVDHLGVYQPPTMQPESPPFKSLPELLELARLPNVVVKFSGAPSLSAKPYPFEDLWPHLHRIVEAFGPQRLMWGSDISRFIGRIGFDLRLAGTDGDYVSSHSYAEALLHLRETNELSAADKEWILGRAALTLLRWEPAQV
jgi:predicted TIM-barrel fold metal-dependent hydrolase